MSGEWEYRPVSEIADHRLGKMLDKRKNKGDFREYLRNVNVRWFSFDLSDLKEMRFTDDECEKYEIAKGDLVVCEGGYPGRAAIWQGEETIFFQKALHRIRFHEQERNEWFLYYLFYLDSSGLLKSYFTGTGIQHFTGQTLAKLNVPLPPLPEQKRIVSILDEAFGAIERAKENAQKNLANARELFESYLNRVFTEKGEGWEEATIEQCFKVRSGDFLPKKKMDSTGTVSVYGGNGKAGTHSESNLSGSNVIIGRVGAKCGNARSVHEPIWLTDNAFYASEFSREFDHNYLSAVLNWVNLRETANQAAQPVISYKTIKPVVIPFQTKRQDQIGTFQSFDNLRLEVSQLEAICQRKLIALDELKQSILQKAFTGQLTAKSPELEAVG